MEFIHKEDTNGLGQTYKTMVGVSKRQYFVAGVVIAVIRGWPEEVARTPAKKYHRFDI